MNNTEIKILEDTAMYLKIHNNVALYKGILGIIDKVKLQRQKDNARKLKYITEKRKENKEYGGHSKDRYKKEGDK